MAKESKYGVLPQPIFRAPFLDESSMIANSGTPVSCTFLNGNIVLNGASSYATYPTVYKGVYSLRFRFSAIAPSGLQYIFDGRANSGTGYLRMDNATTISASSGTLYVDGVASSTISSATKEIIVTGITLATTLDYIGRINSSAANYLNAYIDLFEAYSTTLSASEVSNLYNNCRNVSLSPYRSGITEILNIDGRRGAISNKYGTAIVNTAVTSVRSGRVNAMSFNSGLSSKLNLGTYSNLTGDITLFCLVKLANAGGGSVGRIIDNSKLSVYYNAGKYSVTSDGSTVVSSAASSVAFGVWQMLTITRSTAGTVNIYLNSVLSGSANQASGVPASGTTNITVGNTNAGTSGLSGLMPLIIVVSGLLNVNEISQLFSSLKSQVNL